MVRDWIRRALESAGYVVFNSRSRVCYARDSLFTTNNDNFRDDPDFKAAYSGGMKASGGVDPQIEWRLHVALWAARCAVRVPGDFVECGVNAGFVSSDLAGSFMLPTKCDSFRASNTCPCPVFLFQATIDHAIASFFNDHCLYDFHAICSGAYATGHDSDHSGISRRRPDSR